MIPGLRAHPTPASLSRLPWRLARPLVEALCAGYPAGPTVFWGEHFLLFLLCAPRLRRLRPDELGLDVSPTDVCLWLAEGARDGLRDPMVRVTARLSNLLRDLATQTTLDPTQEQTRDEASPIEQLEASEAWAALSPEDRETLRAALEAPSLAVLAARWGTTANTAKQRLERSRGALRKIKGDL